MMAIDPSAFDQELMQLANRFRSDPSGEFNRLITSISPIGATDPNVEFALKFFQTNLSVVQSEFAALTPAPPLAWDDLLQQIATDYLPFMISNRSQSHDLNKPYAERIRSYNFLRTANDIANENLFINVFSPLQAHAAYVIDWGNGANGLLNSRGHRLALINAKLKTAGMATAPVTYDPTIGFGPNVNAQEFAGLTSTPATVTGAVFQDSNKSSWYDAGEGMGGINLKFVGTGGTFNFSTMSQGGYNAVVPAGSYTVTASGGGLRFPITKSGVTVGSQNVWLNFIYDPAFVPSDAFEGNNDTNSATVLSGNDQLLTDGTIHAGDIDYFKFPAVTTGNLRAELQFPNSSGNLDLKIIDSSGNVLGRSNSTADIETVNINITRGTTAYIVVESATGGVGGPYSLRITAPLPQRPVAVADAYMVDVTASSATLDVLSNDRDPDGDLSAVKSIGGTASHGSVQANGKQLVYVPNRSFSIDTVQYSFVDEQGLSSNTTSVAIMLVDFTRAAPFNNPTNSNDVNGDGSTSAIDILFVINAINTRGSGSLPTSIPSATDMLGYIDVDGSGTVEPIDALLAINFLNSSPSAEGESPSASSVQDMAISALAFENAAAYSALAWETENSTQSRRRFASSYPRT